MGSLKHRTNLGSIKVSGGKFYAKTRYEVKSYFGGSFTSYDGTSRNRIVRLNTDGSIDTGFSVGSGFNNTVNGIAVASDGKVYAVGSFTSYNGASYKNNIIRLNTNGSRDTGANFGTGLFGGFKFGYPYSIAVASDDKVCIAGAFTYYSGTYINRIVRLNTGGSRDTGFSVGSGFNSTVWIITFDSDDKVYAGGQFTSYNGTSTNRIVRLNTNGSIDTGFSVGTGFTGTIYSIVVASDDKVYVGGSFTGYNGTSINRIVRLNTDGSIDTGFSVGTGFNSTVRSIAVASDGKVYVGGDFTSYNGTSINRIARLNTDGSIDTGFSVGSGFNSTVRSIAVVSDGRAYAVGDFTSYNGISALRATKLNQDGSIVGDFLEQIRDFNNSVTTMVLE